MKSKLCFSTGGSNPYDAAPEGAMLIELRQHGRNSFSVRYGLQVKRGLSYSNAALELGAAIMHEAACNGELDNRMPGEF